MPIGALLGGMVSQGGAGAASAAANAAGQGAYKAAQDQAQQDEYFASPFYQTGAAATNALAQAYGLGHLVPNPGGGQNLDTSDPAADIAASRANFVASPGYGFRVQQGVNALDRGAAARGMTYSGAQAKALSDYGQNTGSAEWGNYISGLQGLSGQGNNSANALISGTNSIVGQGINGALQGGLAAAGYTKQGADALASGIVGTQNSLNSLAAFGGSGGKFGLPGFA